MTTSPLTFQLAIQNSQSALNRGDKHLARHWANVAASLDPEREEVWLLLAATANPQASLGYLKRALEINPRSQRARAGMDWALKRAKTAQQASETSPHVFSKTAEITRPVSIHRPVTTQPPAISAKPALAPQPNVTILAKFENQLKSGFQVSIGLLIIAVLLFSIWSASPVMAFFSSTPNLETGAHAPAWAQADIAKPTMTAEPTATALPTPTPTFTETPFPTPTILPTDAPSAGQTGSLGTASQPDPGDTAAYAGQKWILVDISEQHLYAYEGSNLIFSFVASTGINNGTRVGTFAVQSKIPNAYGATWNIWMPDWLGIYYAGGLEDGIHALPILPDGSTLWAGYLGTPISYGCVVLGQNEALQLYNWAEIGTPVKIQR
jgi:lipoprotein-anchoring transpeptidase ErfK/SrfK